MVSKRMTKYKVVLKQNVLALIIVLIWFGSNFIWFLITTGFNFIDTLRIILFFTDGPGDYGHFYDSFTEFITLPNAV